mmetsp:Transcript_36988/g.102055  ORF Transcript_36988/g.102055 Transcript_36988/m.102055 type:complete len:278 (+) Transcript_36988:103-936(+)
MGLRTAFKAWTLRMPPPPPSLPENMTPSEDYLIKLLLSLSIVILTCTVIFKSSNSRALLEALGVSLRRVKRTLQEIDRKGFHLAGILVPIVHHSLLRLNYSNALCIEICAAITIVGWCCDLARLCIPAVARNWPGRSILREKERQQLTGGCYFSLGCTLSIAISPPSIAMASILFLVLGDMSAAIIGVSFGGETVSLKLGREGKKSLEGSFAMFCICFIIGNTIFAEVHLGEYPVFFGALAATITELYEPCRINDNLSIPVLSSLAMQYAFTRIRQC